MVGIDIEAPLVERAKQNAVELGLEKNTEFHFVKPGALNFPNESFDIVMSSGAFTQVADKHSMYQECLRVLKPGGQLTCYDWMKRYFPLTFVCPHKSDYCFLCRCWFVQIESLNQRLIMLAVSIRTTTNDIC